MSWTGLEVYSTGKGVAVSFTVEGDAEFKFTWPSVMNRQFRPLTSYHS